MGEKIDVLNTVCDRLGSFGNGLFVCSPPVGASAVRARDFLQPASVMDMVESMMRDVSTPDRRVAASLFMKHYAWIVTRVGLAPMTLLGVGLDVSIDHVGVVHSGSTTHGLLLSDSGETRILSDRWQRHHEPERAAPSLAALQEFVRLKLVDEHLSLVIDTLYELTSCPRQILWGSAGYAAAYLFDEIAVDRSLARRVIEDRAAFLDQHDAPFSQSVRHEHLRVDNSERSVLIRRACCLWYRVGPDDLCFYCPLLNETDRVETLDRLGLD